MNYLCKDNVTLMLIDLKKYYNDYQTKIKKNMNNSRRYHSQVRNINGGMGGIQMNNN